MKGIGFLISILFIGTIFSQQLLPVQHDTTHYSQEIILTGNGEYSATSLRNELVSKLFWGGEITDPIKQSSFSKHKLINRFGIDLNSEIEYRNFNIHLFNKPSYGIVLKAGAYAIGSAAYSKDAFGTIFFGNADYLGQTANLSGTYFSYISFQKVGIGCINNISKSSLSLNFYTVNDYFGSHFQKASYTEDSDGTSLSTQLSGGFKTTQGKSFVKGAGVGIDFDSRFSVQLNPKRKATFQILAKNIGLVNYYTGLDTYQVDSTYSFDGFSIQQLIGNASLTVDSLNSSTFVDTLKIQHSIEKKTLFLPGYLQIGKIINDNDSSKTQAFYGLRMYPSLAYVPLLYLGGQYSINKHIQLGIQGSVGGFSTFKVGMYATLKQANWSIGIASQDVYGDFSKRGFGKSFLMRIRCVF